MAGIRDTTRLAIHPLSRKAKSIRAKQTDLKSRQRFLPILLCQLAICYKNHDMANAAAFMHNFQQTNYGFWVSLLIDKRTPSTYVPFDLLIINDRGTKSRQKEQEELKRNLSKSIDFSLCQRLSNDTVQLWLSEYSLCMIFTASKEAKAICLASCGSVFMLQASTSFHVLGGDAWFKGTVTDVSHCNAGAFTIPPLTAST